MNYDFRNIKGYDFLGKVRDQGHCGSCFASAFISSVESRLKLKYGKPINDISIQQALSCNYISEGCEGGWPQLLGFFNERAYLVEEECFPYQAKTKGIKCA